MITAVKEKRKKKTTRTVSNNNKKRKETETFQLKQTNLKYWSEINPRVCIALREKTELNMSC